MTAHISIPAGARTYWPLIGAALASYVVARLTHSDLLGFGLLSLSLVTIWLLGRTSVTVSDDALLLRPWGFLGASRRVGFDQVVTARATVVDEDPHLDLILEHEIVSLGPWQPFFRDALLARVEWTAAAVRTQRILARLPSGPISLRPTT